MLTKRKAKPRLRRIVLTEFVLTGKARQIEYVGDEDKGLVKLHGVKICGVESENDRTYFREALKEAIPLYEGSHVNVDHPEKGATQHRSLKDRSGKLEDVEFVEGTDEVAGLYGTLILLRSHPLTKTVVEAAEFMPDAFGLSHNADGKGYDENGRFFVRHIEKLRSVDLVANPATNRGLYESKNMGQTLKSLIEANAKLPAKLKAGLLKLDPEILEAMCEDDAPGVGDDATDWKQHVVHAVGKLVHSEEAEDHETAAKLMKVLKPGEKPEREEEDEEPTEKPEPENEGKKVKGQEAAKPKRAAGTVTLQEAQDLCELAGVEHDKDLLESLVAMGSMAQKHVKYLKSKLVKPGSNGERPRSQSPGSTQTLTEDKREPAECLASLRI